MYNDDSMQQHWKKKGEAEFVTTDSMTTHEIRSVLSHPGKQR